MHERAGEVGAGVGTLNCKISTWTWACKWWQRDQGWDENEGPGGLGQRQYYRSKIVIDSSSLKKESFPTDRMVCICASIYVCVYINVCTYVSVNGMYVCVCTCGYTCLHVCVYVCIWAWVQCEYIYIAWCECVCLCVCRCVHMGTHSIVYMCMHILCVFICGASWNEKNCLKKRWNIILIEHI